MKTTANDKNTQIEPKGTLNKSNPKHLSRLWMSLLLTGTILSSVILPNGIVKAQGISNLGDDLQTSEQSTEENTENSLDQVNSVDEFSDVKPTDWAYESLKSLIERYNCVNSSANGKFDGDRSLTRYEFANDLNTCLDTITKLIAASTSNFIKKEDLASLQRMKQDFSPELADIQARIGKAEDRVTKLEGSQFSTTTKLSGFAWFNVNGSSASGDLKRGLGERDVNGNPLIGNAIEPSITSSAYAWLEFNTSFTGKDSLMLQIAAGNGQPGVNQYTNRGVEYTYSDFTNQSGGVNPGDAVIRELYYQFPVGKDFEVVVGPRFNYFRFFEYNRYAYYFSPKGGPPIFNYLTFNSANSPLVNAIDRGAGAVVTWNINPQFQLRVGYLGESNEYLPNPPFGSAFNPAMGIFAGTNTTTAELTYKASDRANIRFLYTRSNLQAYPQFRDNYTDNGVNVIGNGLAEPIYGVADDGLGGAVNNATANTFAVNFDWAVTDEFGLFGRYAYGNTNISSVNNAIRGDVNSQAFQLGFAFPDLFKRGTIGTLSFVVPFDVLEGRNFLVTGNGNGGTEWNMEASYYLPLTDNIAILPSFFMIFNANNFNDNPTIYIGNLRTQFTF